MELSKNARKVLEKRYLLKDKKGKLVETPEEMFRRVAKNIALVDLIYDEKAPLEDTEERFYQLLSRLEFLPNSPTLMNAGTSLNQLSACFVLPVPDSMEGIFDALKYMALIHKSGGGVGFSFSNLRPEGDVVGSTKGIASGPLSFMTIFDVATDVVKQGGRRRGANMGILHVSHPDIMQFITAKRDEGILSNFNLSVAVDHQFMEAVENDSLYDLINPRNKQRVKSLPAREIFDCLVEMAWASGDPGIIFEDELNKSNPTPHLGKITATNPCGEQPLLDFESCNLGSINLIKMIKNKRINWDKLQETIEIAIHFLDNVIDANAFPLPPIKVQTLKTRKIGLGVMGFAEMLIKLDLPYDSKEALQLAEKIIAFIEHKARKASSDLGKTRGSFPTFKGSLWDKKGYNYMRNATVTTIAPTGSISIIANVTSGIEPLFAVSFVRDVMNGTKLLEVNDIFEKTIQEKGFFSARLMKQIAKTGSLKDMKEIPQEIKEVFVTAHDIDPSYHVKMQATFQKYVDNGVSKTVNLPPHATREDVKNVFLQAYKLHCKGITLYRYGSKKEQVLYLGSIPQNQKHNYEQESEQDPKQEPEKYWSADAEYAGGCPSTNCPH